MQSNKGLGGQMVEQLSRKMNGFPDKIMKNYKKKTITVEVPAEPPSAMDLSSSLLGNRMTNFNATRGPSGYGQVTQQQVNELAGNIGSPPGALAQKVPHKSMVLGSERLMDTVFAPKAPARKPFFDANMSDREKNDTTLQETQSRKRRATSAAVKKAARKAMEKPKS